jgi:hypothetical protein
LVVIADEHELGVSLGGESGEECEVACLGHAGFVDDEHAALGDRVVELAAVACLM